MTMNTIRHHPDDAMLLAHASGHMEAGTSLVLSSHLELCESCRERRRELDALGGLMLDALEPVALADDAFARTLALIDKTGAPARRVSTPPPLPPGTQWPAALAHCSATRWRWIAPGMRWSRVTVPGSPRANVFLLRIAAGRDLPQHSHLGVEMTQVLCGRFHDGRALFGPGDFDLADGEVRHQPMVQDGSECICLTAVDGRLCFEGVMARLFGVLAEV